MTNDKMSEGEVVSDKSSLVAVRAIVPERRNCMFYTPPFSTLAAVIALDIACPAPETRYALVATYVWLLVGLIASEVAFRRARRQAHALQAALDENFGPWDVDVADITDPGE